MPVLNSAIPQQPKTKKPNFLTVILGILAKGAKILKGVKILKPLITVATMGLSSLAYSSGLGWLFGCSFVFLIFLHEIGHVIALKMRGLPCSAPIFIPFLGAVIFAPSMGDPEDEAVVGIAGPVAGGIATSILTAALYFTGSQNTALWLAAYLSAFVNLMNLIPARPLDGGRIMQIVGHYMTYIGIALGFAMVGLLGPGFVLILTLMLIDLKLDDRILAVSTILCLIYLWTMYFLGRAGQSLGACWFDSAFIGFFSILCWVCAWRKRGQLSLNFQDSEAVKAIPSSRKWVWAARWVSLSVALAGLIAIQLHLFPAIHQHVH